MEGCAMGQILHGCATTTEAIRRAIQHSQESLRALARRYGINQKTVAKWKVRESVVDRPTGPKDAKSTVLSVDDEAIIVAFRKHTLLPLDVSLCIAADHSASDTVLLASLPATTWHQSIAGRRRQQTCEEEVQDLSDRL